MRSQEPSNCNLELLQEIFDTIIKSLWIDPNPSDIDSPFDVRRLPVKENPEHFPRIQETIQVKAQLKKLKCIVGFLHEKLNERAAAIKFEWEETLAFTTSHTSPNTEDIFEGSFMTLPPKEESDDSFNSSVDSMSPAQLFDGALNSTVRNTNRYSMVSSVSSTTEPFHTGNQKSPHLQGVDTPFQLSSTPEQSRVRPLQPRAFRESMYLSPHNEAKTPLSKPMIDKIKSRMLNHSHTQTPGYLASTASSRAYAQSSIPEITNTLRPGSAASSNNLRSRSSLPSMKRPSSVMHNYTPQKQQYQFIPSTIMGPPSHVAPHLYSVQEGSYTPSSQTRAHSLRRMSSVSTLRTSYSTSSHKPLPFNSPPQPESKWQPTCTCPDHMQFVDDIDYLPSITPSHSYTPNRHLIHDPHSGIPQLKMASPVRRRYSGVPLYHSQLRDSSYPQRVGSPARNSVSTRVVSDPVRMGNHITDTF